MEYLGIIKVRLGSNLFKCYSPIIYFKVKNVSI